MAAVREKSRRRDAATDASRGTWAHYRSKENPANLITRGLAATAVAATGLRWHGPLWLALRGHDWPTEQEPVADVGQRPYLQAASCALATTPAEPLLSIGNYSRYSKLLRVTAWIRRFVANTRGLRPSTGIPLTSEEILKPECYWLRSVQKTLSSWRSLATMCKTTKMAA